jgi:oligoribonuclease
MPTSDTEKRVPDDDDLFILVDTETFGLNPQTDHILELGFVVADYNFEIVDSWAMVVWENPHYQFRRIELREDATKGDEKAQIVQEMHTKSGLWHDATQFGHPVEEVISEAKIFLDSYNVGKNDPMVGSSVQFDRLMLEAQMPEIFDKFSYRNIDTSTLKELCRRLNPDIYERLDETTLPKKLHRVEPDLEDTLKEFKFYVDNFLWI